MITKDELDDAVNEFIESQKFRDRHLYRQYKDEIHNDGELQEEEQNEENDGDEPPKLVPILKKKIDAPLREDEIETE